MTEKKGSKSQADYMLQRRLKLTKQVSQAGFIIGIRYPGMPSKKEDKNLISPYEPLILTKFS